MDNETYVEKDKWNCPFLLACSFNGLLKFEGSSSQNGVLFFEFSPKDKALNLIKQLRQKKDPKISFLDFIQATDTFWKEVYGLRNEKSNDHGNKK